MIENISQLIPGVRTDDLTKRPNNKYFFTYMDYECKIIRNQMKWTWNGYCRLPPDHPFRGKKYMEIEDKIFVHGNLTYGGPETDGWYGFDCSHFGDISPADETILAGPDNILKKVIQISATFSQNGHYWTFEDVESEIKRMVRQFRSNS